MTKESIRQIIEENRMNFALVTFSASIYQPWKTDTKVTKDTAEANGVTTRDVKVKKHTVAHQLLDRCASILSSARSFHYANTRSWAGRKVGVIPAEKLFEYAEKMRAYRQEFNAAADALAEQWPLIVAEQATRLNGTFRIEDYPTKDEVRSRFRLDTYVDELPTYNDVRINVPDEVVEALSGSFEEQMESRVNGLYKELVEDALKQVRAAAKVLSKSDPQRIRNAMTSNLLKQVKWLRDLNLTGDDRLATLANEIEHGLCRQPADVLRDDAAERDLAAAKAQQILRDMGGAA